MQQVLLKEKTTSSRAITKRALERALRHVILPGTSCQIHRTEASGRKQIELYIKMRFKEAYDANIKEFMPNLLSVECLKGTSAAAGFRTAQHSTLFVENYLKKPIEQTLSTAIQQPVDRNKIVEIGNLASTQRGASQLMFILLLAVLHRANFRWVVFTATQQVEQILGKLRFKAMTLSKAQLSELNHEPDSMNINGKEHSDWGSYYDTNPFVLAGDLDCAMNQAVDNPIMQSVLEHYEETIHSICNQIQAGS